MKKKLFACVCAAVLLISPQSAAAALAADGKDAPGAGVAAYTAQKKRVSVHDPSVFKDPISGTYYVFGSHIDAAKSADLQSWTVFTNGYATANNQLFGNLSANLAKPFAWAGENLEDCKGGFAVWAPDVIWNPDYINSDGSRGAYLMYFCTSSTYMRSVIGFAAAQNPEGPYTCVDTLIYSGFTANDSYATSSTKNVNRKYTSTNIPELIQSGQVTMNNAWFNKDNFNNQLFPNAIDPTIYYDTEGRMYMCYGSWSGGIFTLEIDKTTGRCIHPKTGTTEDGRMVDSYFGTKISGGYGKSGEGPFIEYNADTGFYYLFVTYGGLTSTGGYNMRAGRSRSPLGPFTDAAGRNMVLEANPNLNAIGLKLMTNYKFSSLPRAYMACGHNSVLRDDDGKWYLINHTRFDDGSEYHEVRVHAMTFNEAGWPVVMPYEYSGDAWPQNGFDPADLIGDYEFIDHGLGTDGTITNAAKITLNGDGSITGAVNGTWHEDIDTAAASFTIGSVTYTGYFAPQYDETGKGHRVMTFTAAGKDNHTLWGARTDAWTGKEIDPVYNHVGSAHIVYDKNAAADASGAVRIGETKLLSNVSYSIVNVNSGLLLDCTDGAVQQWENRGGKSGNPSQEFRLTDMGGGWCRITSMADESLCITVNESSAENGIDLSVKPYSGADTQLWKPVQSGGYYGIVSKCSGGAAGLDVYEWSVKNGGTVKQWEFWGGECQLWKLEPTYAMMSAHAFTLRCIADGSFAGAENGALIPVQEPVSWNFRLTDSGKYIITDGSGMALTAADGDAGFTLKPETGDVWQQFSVICNADGSYGLLLDISDLQTSLSLMNDMNDSFAQQPYSGSNEGQKFVFAPAEPPEAVLPETTETVTETTAAETDILPALLLGDVDCSGTVNIADAILFARFLAEDTEISVTLAGKRNANCNGDGQLNAEDNTIILEYLAGLRETI